MDWTSPYDARVELLLKVLPVICEDTRFAIKGGTAINLFLRDMPRLSVDIDLVYLALENRTQTIANINEAFSKIIAKLKRIYPDVNIFPSKSLEKICEKKLFIESNGLQIKIEPNYILRGTLYNPVSTSLCERAKKKYNMAINIPIASTPDLYGSKICAALDRQHPRDLFDVKGLFENEGFNHTIRQTFIFYLISHNRAMIDLLDPNFKDIRQQFKTEFIGMTKENVEIEMLEQIRETLVKKLSSDLTQNEKKFLISIKKLNPDWSLFPIDGIAKYPAIKWKLHNLKMMDNQKRFKAIEKLEKYLFGK